MSTVAQTDAPTGLRWSSTAPIVFAVVGSGLVWWAALPITRYLDSILPAAMTVGSRGTRFPAFDPAFSYTLRALALSALAAVCVAIVARHPLWHRAPRVVPGSAYGALGVVGVAVVVFWHFGWPWLPTDNARMHWVDILYGDRTTSFFYTLAKPFHIAFYDHPQVWNALIGAACVGLTYLVGRRLFGRSWVPVLMAASLLTSGLFLTFADPGEGVMLNIAVLLLALLAYLHRHPWGLGVMFFVVTLGRPTFVFLVGAVVASELLLGPPGGARARGITARVRALWEDGVLVKALALGGGLFALWHAFLLTMGWSWIWRDGELLPSDLVGDDVFRFPVDGFTISPFSGAYLLHSLWMYPVAILVANAVVAWRFTTLPDVARRAFVVTWVVTIASHAFHEWQPIWRYNVRYIVYTFPFVLICAWLVLMTRPRRGRTRLPAVAIIVLLALAPATIPQQATAIREDILERPVVALMDDREGLRAAVGDERLSVTSDVTSIWAEFARSTLSYVLRRDIEELASVEAGELPKEGLLYTERPTIRPGEIVYERGDALIIRPDPP